MFLKNEKKPFNLVALSFLLPLASASKYNSFRWLVQSKLKGWSYFPRDFQLLLMYSWHANYHRSWLRCCSEAKSATKCDSYLHSSVLSNGGNIVVIMVIHNLGLIPMKPNFRLHSNEPLNYYQKSFQCWIEA